MAMKIAAVTSLAGHPLLQPTGELDGAYYAFLAERVAGGDVWLESRDSFLGHPAPPFFVSPLYIYFLAGIFTLGGSLAAARLVQAVLGTCAVALLALTARRWHGSRAGWMAGTLAALCGLFTFYETLILQAALDPFLTSLDLYLLTRALQADRPSWWAAAGAGLGLHVLNRPNLLIVLAGLAAIVIVRGLVRIGHERWPSTARGLLLAAAGLAVIAPATVRNWRVSGELVLVSSHGGLNFFIGNGPDATGTFTRVLDLEPSITGQWLGAVDTVGRELGRPPTAADVSDYFYGQAFAWIHGHPADALALVGRKTWYALSATFLTLNHSFPFFAEEVEGPLGWLVVGPWLIVPLGLVGLVVAQPRNVSGYWVWAAYVPLAILAIVIFYVAARYRLPYQVALTVAAGGGLSWLLDRRHPKSRAALAAALSALAVLAAVVNWPTGLDDGRADERTRMGLIEIEAGRPEAGEAWIARARADHVLPGTVHVRAGQAYESRNDLTNALRHYDEALAIDPDEPSVHFVRGRALYYLGRLDEARASLERARGGPQSDASTRLLVLTAVQQEDNEAAQTLFSALRPEGWTADEARTFAEALMSLGRADLSVSPWRRASAASGLAEDYERLGLALTVVGRPREALDAFREGVSRNGRSASLRLNLAVMLAEAGQVDDAKREAAEALRLDPNYDRAKALLAALQGGRD